MGNEVNTNSNSNHKILTDQSSFNKSNLREIQDSNSESKIKKENENNNRSSSLVNSKDEEEYEADEEINKSKEKIKSIKNDMVEYIFIWEEKCNIAKVIGSFNNWKDQLLMTFDPKDNVYKYKLELKRDKYEYKFIIDNSWKFSKYQETKNDGKGNINNFIDLTNYNKQIFDTKKTKKMKKKKKKKKKKIQKVESFGVLFPTKEELNTEAPITQELYLKSFFINEATNQDYIGEKNYYKFSNRESYTEEKSYRNLLFSPHVNLNHTMSFCDNKDILQVGLSYRFRNKDCTLVYYSRLNQ